MSLVRGFYFHSKICSVFIKADGRVVKETILLNDDTLKEDFKKKSCSFDEFPLPGLIDCLKKYFSRKKAVSFDFECDLSSYTPLEQKILSIVKRIPYGETMTYEDIAKTAGNKNLRRMVGRTAAKNKLPVLIPCHRVLGKGGKLTGFSADGGVRLKEKLLSMERISLASNYDN
jgi:methylated-DNA-[protein]-cysteine S-methyltransferase